jgi:hypothetical protein
MEEKTEKFPEGHVLGMWMGIGIAIFSGIGIPICIATGNFGFLGIGPAMGVAFGVAIGQSEEEKYKGQGKLRPLTEQEKKRKEAGIKFGLIALTLLTLLALSITFR